MSGEMVHTFGRKKKKITLMVLSILEISIYKILEINSNEKNSKVYSEEVSQFSDWSWCYSK